MTKVCTVVLLLMALGMASVEASAAQDSPQPRDIVLPAQYVDLPGVHLLYRDSGGTGPVVVFMHAHTGNSTSWVHQIPAFTAAGYRVITYDRRGYGDSVPTTTGPQPGTGADDLQGLLDHLGVKRFYLVATAAGAMVGLDYAVSFQQHLISMVIANTLGGLRDDELAAMGQRIRFSGFGKLPSEVKELSPSYRAVHPEGVKRWLAIEHTNHQQPFVRQRYRNVITRASLGALKVPALFIAGEADPYMPPPVMRVMASAVPNAKGVVIPLTSHSAYWEQPEIFNQVVLEFLSQHRDQ